MRLITSDDFVDVYHKLLQRGSTFLLSKINPNKKARTLSAFDDTAFNSANWWIVPAVKERWNSKITDETTVDYETYTVAKYFSNKTDLKLLSLGSGVCSHELKFAQHPQFQSVTCVDIAANLLEKAEAEAQKLGLHNMEFRAEDIYQIDLQSGTYDIILFHSSLHHLHNIEAFIQQKVKAWLKPGGLLLINEYVGPNRLQFSKAQIKAINEALDIIPRNLKKRFQSRWHKRSFSGSGLVRMIMADPSECVESENIRPILRQYFEVVEEKPFGGNILMNVLKDIAHNFIDPADKMAQQILQQLFVLEDQFLEEHPSDFLFGIYRQSD